jgi:hypothetical protein
MEDLLKLGNCVNESECGECFLQCFQFALIICPIVILAVFCYLLKQLVFLQLLTYWDDITTCRYWLQNLTVLILAVVNGATNCLAAM